MTAGVDEVALAPLRERVRSVLIERTGVSRRKATMAVLLFFFGGILQNKTNQTTFKTINTEIT